MCCDRTAESINSSPNEKRKIRKPKIELSHIGGELKDYLEFWSQFQRIHTNQDLAPEDKFQYLLQCMVQENRAREVIESFPPTSENYAKAIEALKNRFGREELFIEFYVQLLGIKEPTEETSREEAVKFFNDTLSTDFDGRYVVRIPWTDNSSLTDSNKIAEKKITFGNIKTNFVRKIF
ncbi:uncharacterized protein TNCV_3829781 [Trichonephila clavipes]|nr:uncharacterized protein TNCV_3829781 [Trichonephila clavipes]